MTNPKDQLQLYYEQQKTLIEQIKILREDLQKEQKLTTQFRKEKLLKNLGNAKNFFVDNHKDQLEHHLRF